MDFLSFGGFFREREEMGAVFFQHTKKGSGNRVFKGVAEGVWVKKALCWVYGIVLLLFYSLIIGLSANHFIICYRLLFLSYYFI